MAEQQTVLVIGLGLIGASFAKALKTTNTAYVFGTDVNPEVPETAQSLGIIDEAITDVSELKHVDVIVLAVPVLAIESVMATVKHLVPTLTALTDVGSVKGAVVDAVEEALGILPRCFVPGHPIAGAEKSGVHAANEHLFEKHMHILTPLDSSSTQAVECVTQLWQQCGADVVTMTVERHDEVLAATSHLPHLLAFSLVDTLARESRNREIFQYAAGGFRDFSRIAASDPTMWHDIFLMNKTATLKILRRFQSDLSLLENAIEEDNGDLLHATFTRAKSARDYFTDILEAREHGRKLED